MEEMLPKMFEYGVLGLWTFSLMWRERTTEKRHQSQLDKLEERHVEQMKDFLEMRERIHSEIVDELKEVSHKLDLSLGKINEGLRDMREKYAEERLRDRLERDRPE
jgi:hypothetical protein